MALDSSCPSRKNRIDQPPTETLCWSRIPARVIPITPLHSVPLEFEDSMGRIPYRRPPSPVARGNPSCQRNSGDCDVKAIREFLGGYYIEHCRASGEASVVSRHVAAILGSRIAGHFSGCSVESERDQIRLPRTDRVFPTRLPIAVSHRADQQKVSNGLRFRN
jgi:hypothetical protein